MLAELSYFYRQICAKKISKKLMQRFEKEIVVLICKMKKLFSPGFMNCMQHLLVHLPWEALVGGPIAEDAPMTDLSAFQWYGKGVGSYTSHLVGMKEHNKTLLFLYINMPELDSYFKKSLIAYIKQTNNLLKRSWMTYA
jgi:hypothetical protein